LSYDVRQLKNRKRKILFHRVWVRAVLEKPGPGQPPVQLSDDSSSASGTSGRSAAHPLGEC
jgi:hypothetical protein